MIEVGDIDFLDALQIGVGIVRKAGRGRKCLHIRTRILEFETRVIALNGKLGRFKHAATAAEFAKPETYSTSDSK